MKKYHILTIWLSLFLMAAFPVTIEAQSNKTTTTGATRTVKGIVVDENDEPVIGATVTIVGQSNKGVITDIDGKFVLDVPEKGKIKISYLGYETRVISKLDNPRVVLYEDATNLDEAVIVGYGALKPKNVTGSIEVIDAKELQDLSVSNLSEALVGISPSIHVDMPSTGRPGENAMITIRQAKDAVKLTPTGTDFGGQAIGGDANPSPLFVIDDFISTEEDFNNLDVDEVESLTILKDASAAIYGAYGAYGVILVKTKRGKAGLPKISYSTQIGYVDAVKHADMLNGYQYGLIYNAARAAGTSNNEADKDDLLKNYFQADELQAMKKMNYNLLDKYWNSSLSQRHSVNVNGGNEKATYFTSVSYYTQDGNIGKLDYDRWNYRAGVTANVTKYFKARLNISGDYSSRNSHMTSSKGGNEQDYVYMMKNPAYIPDNINGYPIYHSGMENSPSFDNYYNYKSLNESRNNQEEAGNSLSLQASLEHDFSWCKPLKGLLLKFTYSKSISNDKTNRIRMENTVYRVKNRGGSGQHLYINDPSMIIDNDPLVDYDDVTLEGFRYTDYENLEKRVLNEGQNSYISRTMNRSDSYQMNLMLMYSRKFGDHDVSGTFSIERSESESENVTAQGTHPLSFTDGQSASLADDSEKTVSWSRSEGGSLSYIGRLNYSYKDKYLFEFLIRSQASTKFSPDNYWGAFPGVSAGWVASEESWFDKEKLKIDFLKFRASFGVMGRDNVEAWRWLQLYSFNEYGGSIFGTNPNVESGRSFQLPEKSGTNPNLRWDKNYKTNFGIDIRALDDRLSVSLDGYYDMGREMFDFPTASFMPGTVGIYPAPENYAELDSYGAEIIVGWRQRFNKDSYLSVRLGSGYDDNKVKKRYMVDDPDFDDVVEGKRTDRGLWGLSCMGIFRSYQQIDEYFKKYNITNYLGKSKADVHPGMLIYEDIRGAKDEDGNYTDPDGVISAEDDRVKVSKWASNPYNMNLNLNFIYKQFSLNATFQAEWGAYTYLNNIRNESYGDLETTNVSALWKDMFVYEDVFDAEGRKIAYANRDGRYPNLRYSDINSQASTFWRLSAAQVLLRNITLAYTLPKQWLRHLGVSNLRINATCQNAFSFYNPIPDNVWDDFAGTYGAYPITRKITIGANITF